MEEGWMDGWVRDMGLKGPYRHLERLHGHGAGCPSCPQGVLGWPPPPGGTALEAHLRAGRCSSGLHPAPHRPGVCAVQDQQVQSRGGGPWADSEGWSACWKPRPCLSRYSPRRGHHHQEVNTLPCGPPPGQALACPEQLQSSHKQEVNVGSGPLNSTRGSLPGPCRPVPPGPRHAVKVSSSSGCAHVLCPVADLLYCRPAAGPTGHVPHVICS